MIEWISQNKERFFSEIGISILGLLVWIVRLILKHDTESSKHEIKEISCLMSADRNQVREL